MPTASNKPVCIITFWCTGRDASEPVTGDMRIWSRFHEFIAAANIDRGRPLLDADLPVDIAGKGVYACSAQPDGILVKNRISKIQKLYPIQWNGFPPPGAYFNVTLKHSDIRAQLLSTAAAFAPFALYCPLKSGSSVCATPMLQDAPRQQQISEVPGTAMRALTDAGATAPGLMHSSSSVNLMLTNVSTLGETVADREAAVYAGAAEHAEAEEAEGRQSDTSNNPKDSGRVQPAVEDPALTYDDTD